MSTPGDLVRALAGILGLSEGTVTQFDRQLAGAGLRTKGGRGTSAARVTPQDASNLLIAIAASPISGLAIKEAAETCQTYASLPLKTLPSIAAPFKNLGLPRLANLPRRHTLGFAISELICAAAAGETMCYRERGKLVAVDWLFGINFAGPTPWAEIIADGSMGEHKADEFGRLVYHAIPTTRGRLRTPDEGDLSQERHISFSTIRELAGLFQ